MPLNFDLPALDAGMAADVSMAFDGASIDYGRSTDATVVLYVPLADLEETFKFKVDASDVNDLDAQDTEYIVQPASFPKINVAHAMADDATYSAGQIATGYAANRMLMKHDYMRHVALELFNTHHGLDLVSNEVAVSKNFSAKGTALYNTDISQALYVASGSGAGNLQNDASGNTNISRELLRHIMETAPERLETVRDGSGSQIHSIPFEVDDTLNFHVTVGAAPGQNALTGRTAAISTRTYRVILVAKSDITGLNTAPETTEGSGDTDAADVATNAA